jgi:hypothetical protein
VEFILSQVEGLSTNGPRKPLGLERSEDVLILKNGEVVVEQNRG